MRRCRCNRRESHVIAASVLMFQVPPPFTPKVKSEGDFSNFDKFDDVELKILPKDKFVREFADF